MANTNIPLYPIETNTIQVFPDSDGYYETVLYDNNGVTPINITGWAFTTNFYTALGGSNLGSVTTTNNDTGESTRGQVRIFIPLADVPGGSMASIGYWVMRRTDTVGQRIVYDHGPFEVSVDPSVTPA